MEDVPPLEPGQSPGEDKERAGGGEGMKFWRFAAPFIIAATLYPPILLYLATGWRLGEYGWAILLGAMTGGLLFGLLDSVIGYVVGKKFGKNAGYATAIILMGLWMLSNAIHT